MRFKSIAGNILILGMFYFFVSVALYGLSKFFLRNMPLNTDMLSTEFLSNVLMGTVIPYSSLVSGFFVASISEDRKPTIGQIMENPFIYFSIWFIYLAGPSIVVYIFILLVASLLVQILTNFERPRPLSSVANGSVDARYVRSDFAATLAIHQSKPNPLKPLVRLGLWLVVLLSAAPVGILALVITISAIIAGLIYPTRESVEIFGHGPTFIAGILSYITFFLPIMVSSWLLLPPVIYAYRLVARVGKAVDPDLRNDTRKAIYLRRFERDRLRRSYTPQTLWFHVLNSIPGLQPFVVYANRLRLEDSIVRALADAAQLIAVGDPTEALPLLGASRIYVRSEDWRTTVVELTRAADIVILVADFSAAIDWEMEVATSGDDRTRAVLVLPEPKRGREWYQHWAALQQKGFCLPNVTDKTAVVVFDSAGNPLRVDVSGHWNYWQDAVSASLVQGLSEAGQSRVIEVEFGPRIRGSSIVKLATVGVTIGLLLGYILPMVGFDLMQFFKFDPLAFAFRR
jgi:hypothetical protein